MSVRSWLRSGALCKENGGEVEGAPLSPLRAERESPEQGLDFWVISPLLAVWSPLLIFQGSNWVSTCWLPPCVSPPPPDSTAWLSAVTDLALGVTLCGLSFLCNFPSLPSHKPLQLWERRGERGPCILPVPHIPSVLSQFQGLHNVWLLITIVQSNCVPGILSVHVSRNQGFFF